MLSTNIGLEVKWSADSNIEVSLLESYSTGTNVCGMCGNFNGNSADDVVSLGQGI